VVTVRPSGLRSTFSRRSVSARESARMMTWTAIVTAGDAVLWSADVEAPTMRDAKERALALMAEGGGRQPENGATGAAGEIEVKIIRAASAAIDDLDALEAR
jgi:hypothetical protein